MIKCADCDCSNPEWASVNRGVVLCDDCSSVHRQLGRHVSQIKHLTKSRWRKTQLAMLKSLAQSGANKYWEHLLLESSLRQNNDSVQLKHRKPSPKDPIHPNKMDFIKEKYVHYGYFKKPRAISVDDLNQQLHASVRTGFLETSLYLLTLGARPNYVHPNRQTTPLHVATMNNQPLQVELLLTYGGDLLQTDGNGDTPLQIAQKKSQASQEPLKWQVLLSSLLEAQFELTDSLSYFLCRQTIDHSIHDTIDPSRLINNFLIPKIPDSKFNTITRHAIEQANQRLLNLPNGAFIDLCIDVCDEIDRREINDCILATGPNGTVPNASKNRELCLYFLPPNADYSSTRNQGRQKLARLSNEEFRKLCYDCLVEASIRLSGSVHQVSQQQQQHVYQLYKSNNDANINNDSTNNNQIIRENKRQHRSSLPLGSVTGVSDSVGDILQEDHDPVYDQVAADGDYAYIMDLHRSQGSPLPSSNLNQSKLNNGMKSSGAANQQQPSQLALVNGSNNPSTGGSGNNNNNNNVSNQPASQNNEVELLNKIDDLTGHNKLLQARNNELEKKITKLEQQIEKLQEEKAALLKIGGIDGECRKRRANKQIPDDDDDDNGDNDGGDLEDVSRLLAATEGAYDSGSDRFNSGPWLRQEVIMRPSIPPAGHMPGGSRRQQGYDNSDSLPPRSSPAHSASPASSSVDMTTAYHQHQQLQMHHHHHHHQIHHQDYDIPPHEDTVPLSIDNTPNQVVHGVETISYQIHTLLEIANGRKRGDFVQCSRIIQSAVQQLVRLFSTGCERRLITPTSTSSQNVTGSGPGTHSPASSSSSIIISGALRDLLAHSRDLRVRCEQRSSQRAIGPNTSTSNSNNNNNNNNSNNSNIDTGLIIQHAHEIASAAKLLLSHYQHEQDSSTPN